MIDVQASRSVEVLLITWDGAGNLPPQRSLIRSLVERGHRVRIIAPASVERRIMVRGAHFLPHTRTPVRDSRDPASDRISIRRVTEAPGLIADLREAVGDIRPSILLSDFFIHPAVEFGKSVQLPTFALGQTLFGSVADGPLPRALEAADRVIMFSHRSFDSCSAKDSRYLYVGTGRPYDRDWPLAWSTRRPHVLVSLSTSYQHQMPLLQRLCDALSTLDVEALVTTGPAIDPGGLRCGGNVQAVSFASHDQLLPDADLLITHGGHGTTLAGAVYGVPMLVLPMGRDQPWVAAEASRLGIATQMQPNAHVNSLRRAVDRLLSDNEAACRAKAFSAALPPDESLDTAVAAIEKFAAG